MIRLRARDKVEAGMQRCVSASLLRASTRQRAASTVTPSQQNAVRAAARIERWTWTKLEEESRLERRPREPGFVTSIFP